MEGIAMKEGSANSRKDTLLISCLLILAICFLMLPMKATAQSKVKTLSQLLSERIHGVQASFMYSPTQPVPGKNVQFTDTSTNGPTSWRWDFGDGTTSTFQNPSHAFTAAGLYKVTLTAANNAGSRAKSRTITVMPSASISSSSSTTSAASFKYAPTSPVAGQAVQFTDTSTNSPTSWRWHFGDGMTSTAQNPSHPYGTAGTYTVTLDASNSSTTKTISQTLTVGPALVAAFSYTPTSPAVGQIVQFADTSTGSPTSWQWDFGDGTNATSQNPTHSYSSAASYTVTLTVTNAYGSQSVNRTITIIAALSASFAVTPASPAARQAAQFTDTSTGSPTAWRWNFGDGSASTIQNPSHTFVTAASYTVALTVGNASGSKSVTQTVTVVPALTASFSYSPTLPATGEAIQFTDNSTGTPTSWQWDFGDSTSSTLQNPNHTYSAAGSYTVTLTIRAGSSLNSISRSILVGRSLAASFTYSPTSPAVGQSVLFTDTSTGNPTSWLWDFGDGETSTSQDPTHAYMTERAYTVTLSVSNASGSNAVSQSVNVSPAGQLYSLPEDRKIDWSNAGVWYGGAKGIPTYPVGIDLTGMTSYGGHTLDPTGVNDSTAAIQVAIAACPNYHAVYLPPGTYYINGNLSWNANSGNRAIVLRGAGANSTILNQYGTTTDTITFFGGSSSPSTDVLSGYTKGSNSIVVESASGFAVGYYVRVAQANDTTVMTQESGALDDRIMGYETECMTQYNQITGINGTTITLLRPLYYTYNASFKPTLTRENMIVNSGVEDLKIYQVADGSPTANIHMTAAAFCWVKGVESDHCHSNHIEVQDGLGCEIRFNYLHHGWVYTSGRAYGVWLFEKCTDCLVEDNIMYYMRHAVATELGGQGNVIAYNYAERTFGDSYPNDNYLMETIVCHGGYPLMNLFEGNVVSHLVFDDALGGSLWNTAFRNWSQGYSLNYAGTGNMTTNLDCIEVQKCNRDANLIGNVLGMPGFAGYVYSSSLTSVKTVYRFGNAQSNGTNPDTRCESSAIVHGNYDYPLDETVWTDAGHTLPNSYYLSSKPVFFGSITWPPIGPDVVGYVVRIPAQIRFEGGVGHYFDNPPK